MLRALLEWPALLTRTSTRPWRSIVQRTTSAASAVLPTSAARLAQAPPARSTAATTSASGALRRPTITTWAPSAARIRAVARPMPVPPPVTMATWPWSDFTRASPSDPAAPGRHASIASRGTGASAPGPDGLLEVVHARGPPVDDDLAHLVHDGGRGRVDQRAEDREL